jgi:hypothetical protein
MRRRGLLIAGMIVLVIVCLTILALLHQPQDDQVIRGAARVRPPKPAPAVALRTVDGPLRVRPPARPGDSVASAGKPDSALATVKERQAAAAAVAATSAFAEGLPARPKSIRGEQAAPRQEQQETKGAELKVTSTWANIRGNPTSDSQVVRVLRPGTEVAVIPQGRAWWPVVENGKQVGYVSRGVLRDRAVQQ